MRVAVVGANGQLGSELVQVLAARDVYPLTQPACDVCNAASVRETLEEIRPAVVINTAAFTDVDRCEDNVWQAFDVNACAVRTLASACAELRAVLVHVSTDYVFDGEKRSPYREDDVPRPLSVYGVSKLAGEHFVHAIWPRSFIVRTSGLYAAAGSRGKGGNFVETMLRMARAGQRIRVVNDQVLTPTYAKDLATVVARLIQTDAYGLYHATNSGACSWYEFAGRIFTRLGMRPDFGPTTSAEWSARAQRPPYSVLAHEKLVRAGGGELPAWTDALDAYLTEKGYV